MIESPPPFPWLKELARKTARLSCWLQVMPGQPKLIKVLNYPPMRRVTGYSGSLRGYTFRVGANADCNLVWGRSFGNRIMKELCPGMGNPPPPYPINQSGAIRLVTAILPTRTMPGLRKFMNNTFVI